MATIIVTDTGSDLLPAEAKRYGIELVPLWLLFGNERFRDGFDIDRETFFRRLKAEKELPKTEPATAAEFDGVFKRLVGAGNDVVVLPLSSALSKTYENACTAASPYAGKVHVVDTKAGSGLLMLISIYAAELAAGGVSAVEVAVRSQRGRLRGQAYFVMPDVTFLGRTGRLPKAVVALGSMLNVSLILRMTETGEVGPAGQTRNFEKCQEMMVDIVMRNLGDAQKPRFSVTHAHAPEAAAALLARLKGKLPPGSPEPIMTEAAGTISANLGAGALGVCAIVPS